MAPRRPGHRTLAETRLCRDPWSAPRGGRWVFLLVLVILLQGACGTDGGAAATDTGRDTASDGRADTGPPPPGHAIGDGSADLFVLVDESPPALRFVDGEGRSVCATAPGVVAFAAVETAWVWQQGFLGVAEEAVGGALPLSLADGTAAFTTADSCPDSPPDALCVRIADAAGQAVATVAIAPGPGGVGAWVAIIPAPDGPAANANRAHLRLRLAESDRIYGLGGQSQSMEHRGQTIPIRVTEQGLGKSPALPESSADPVGHAYDAYFPLPYALVARPQPDARAYGVVLVSEHRSRFLLGSVEPDVLEIQAAVTTAPDVVHGDFPTAGARWLVLPGPTPKAVVGQFSALFGRQTAVPDWAFGPWVALRGEPLEVAAAADDLVARAIPATAIWSQDFRHHDHPDLPPLVTHLHGHGLRVLTYLNPFLDPIEGDGLLEDAIAAGYVPTTPDGAPYVLKRIGRDSTVVDLTNPAARQWMGRRLAAAYATGVDGFMADYGEWVAPDMHFHDGRVGETYANLYCRDWAALNQEVQATAATAGSPSRGLPFAGAYFSRSGYLGSTPYLQVVWAGDQNTDFGEIDGLPSVIPYGVHLGLAGVSAYAHDIAGFTGLVTPPSTKELYFRWTTLGAYSPVMRTHRGFVYSRNWDWNSDEETVAHFRRWAGEHLRLMPYLRALHDEAMATGVPAMRHPVLEFPAWPGAAETGFAYLLGPALYVAPVVAAGATGRDVLFPPGGWYDLRDGHYCPGPAQRPVTAAMTEIPVFLRAGGIVPRYAGERVRLPADDERGAAALDLWVGLGGDGEAPLPSGGVARLTAADPDTVTGDVCFAADGGEDTCVVIAACPAGVSPALTPAGAPTCYGVAAEGRIVTAPWRGAGVLRLSAAATGAAPARVEVTGGRAERVVTVQLFRR